MRFHMMQGLASWKHNAGDLSVAVLKPNRLEVCPSFGLFVYVLKRSCWSAEAVHLAEHQAAERHPVLPGAAAHHATALQRTEDEDERSNQERQKGCHCRKEKGTAVIGGLDFPKGTVNFTGILLVCQVRLVKCKVHIFIQMPGWDFDDFGISSL